MPLPALPCRCVSVINVGEQAAIGILSDAGLITLKARVIDRQIKPACLLSHRDINRCTSQGSGQARQFIIRRLSPEKLLRILPRAFFIIDRNLVHGGGA